MCRAPSGIGKSPGSPEPGIFPPPYRRGLAIPYNSEDMVVSREDRKNDGRGGILAMVELTPEVGMRSAKPRRSRTFWWGLGALGILTAIWGYSNIVIRQLEHSMSPAELLIIRFGLVGLLGLPWVFRGPRISPMRWLGGLAVGFFLASATLAQAISMESIPVDSVAFITALYVILTPLFMALWRRRMPHRIVIAAALVSLIGVGLLVGHFTVTAATGTLWALLAAVVATLQIIGTAEVSRVMTTIQLAIVEALGAFVTLVVYALITHAHASNPHLFAAVTGSFSWAVWWRLGYLAVLGTLVAVWLQVWGQSQLTATEAALAFNMEPVWTAVFAWLVFAQWLRWLQVLGAALIVASLVALSVTGEETSALEIPDAKAPYREH